MNLRFTNLARSIIEDEKSGIKALANLTNFFSDYNISNPGYSSLVNYPWVLFLFFTIITFQSRQKQNWLKPKLILKQMKYITTVLINVFFISNLICQTIDQKWIVC